MATCVETRLKATPWIVFSLDRVRYRGITLDLLLAIETSITIK